MRYYWDWSEPGWVDRLKGVDVTSEEYAALWERHLNSTTNFCDFYKAITGIALEVWPKHVRITIAQQLASLEAGDIKRFQVDDLTCWAKED